MENSSTRYDAVLLLGPSGVGKTPLGELFEERGLGGRRCVHFDFGTQLRQLVAEDQPNDWISREEIEFLREVLRSGALLEDRHFPLAGRILQAFLARRKADRSTLIVLNGFPRHPGQAAALESIPLSPVGRSDAKTDGNGPFACRCAASMSIEVMAVVYLRCDEETILRRISGNVGGDRTDRADDDTAKVRRRFRTFSERTVGLLDFYRHNQVKIETVDVTATMAAVELHERLRNPQTRDNRLSGGPENP